MKNLFIALSLLVYGVVQAAPPGGHGGGGGRPTPPGPRPGPVSPGHGHPGGGHGGGFPGGGHGGGHGGGFPGGGHGGGHGGGFPGGGHGGGHGGGFPGGGHGHPGHGGYVPPIIRPVPYPYPYPRPYPVPVPVYNACGYLAGSYFGTCRATAGTSGIGFTVQSQGASCIVANSNYFAPAILGVSGNRGYAANLVGQGVAINNTQLTVYGNGQFQFTGYNYAGNFSFSCSN